MISCFWLNCTCSNLKSTTLSRTTPRPKPPWPLPEPTPTTFIASHQSSPKSISCQVYCTLTIRITKLPTRTFMKPWNPSLVPATQDRSTVSSTWFCAKLWVTTRMMFHRSWMVNSVSSTPLIVIFKPSRKSQMPISHHQSLLFRMFSRNSAGRFKEMKLSTITQNYFTTTCSKRTCSKSSNHIPESTLFTSPANCRLRPWRLKENFPKCIFLFIVRILDKKITGTLDQSNGCLIIYH